MTGNLSINATTPAQKAGIVEVDSTTNYFDQASIYSNGAGINPYMMYNSSGGIFGAAMPPGFEAYETKFALAMNSPVAQFGGNMMSGDIQSMLSGFYNFFLKRAQAQTKAIGDKLGAPAAGKDGSKPETKMTDEEINKAAEDLAKKCNTKKEAIVALIKDHGLEEAKKLLGITDDKKDDKKTEDDKGGKEVKKDAETDETKEAKKAKKEKEAADKKAADAKAIINKNQEYAIKEVEKYLNKTNPLADGINRKKAEEWVRMEDRNKLLDSLVENNFKTDVIRSAFGFPISKEDKPLSQNEKDNIWNPLAIDTEKATRVGNCFGKLTERDESNYKVEMNHYGSTGYAPVYRTEMVLKPTVKKYDFEGK